MKVQKIEDYQYEELLDGRLFINKYDLDLKYNYELDIYWKELFFDIMSEITKNGNLTLLKDEEEKLLDYFKRDWENIIKEYNITKIDIRDYIELNDYISYEDWIQMTGSYIAFKNLDIYLLQED